jgi:hypothetical protein
MASAAKLIEALAKEIGWSTPAVEAYALELRRMGWWPPTKRGRGATSITVNDGAKLLLSVLSDGPKSLAKSENDPLAAIDGSGFFLRSANLGFHAKSWNAPYMGVLQHELGLKEGAMFLDYIDAILSMFVAGTVERIVKPAFHPAPQKWDFTGANVEFAISGPWPVGTIKFMFAKDFAKRLIEDGFDRDEVMYPQELVFMHQMFDWKRQAGEKNEPTDVYDTILMELLESSAKGLRYEKAFGGRELSACAAVLRDGVEGQD